MEEANTFYSLQEMLSDFKIGAPITDVKMLITHNFKGKKFQYFSKNLELIRINNLEFCFEYGKLKYVMSRIEGELSDLLYSELKNIGLVVFEDTDQINYLIQEQFLVIFDKEEKYIDKIFKGSLY